MFKLTGIGHLNGRVPLIRQGENLASNLEITLPIDFQGYTYNIITKVNNDPPIYSPPITPVNNILIFPIIIDFTRHDGTITFELLASTAQGIVAKTSKVTYPIVPTLTEQDDEAPDPYSHWLTGFNGAVDEATRQAGLAEKYAITAGTKSLEANGHANTASTNAHDAEQYANTASTNAHDAEQYATTAGEQAGIATTQAGIAEGHATTASQQAGIAAGHATTASTKAGEANASAIAAAGSAGTATAKAQIATDKAAEAVETLAGTVKKTQTVNTKALTGDIVINAGDIGITPSGGISATNVQGAIEELAGKAVKPVLIGSVTVDSNPVFLGTSVTIDTTTGIFTITGHGLVTGDKIAFASPPFIDTNGGALTDPENPLGTILNCTYYVTVETNDTFYTSLTSGGVKIIPTSEGTKTRWWIEKLSIGSLEVLNLGNKNEVIFKITGNATLSRCGYANNNGILINISTSYRYCQPFPSSTAISEGGIPIPASITSENAHGWRFMNVVGKLKHVPNSNSVTMFAEVGGAFVKNTNAIYSNLASHQSGFFIGKHTSTKNLDILKINNCIVYLASGYGVDPYWLNGSKLEVYSVD